MAEATIQQSSAGIQQSSAGIQQSPAGVAPIQSDLGTILPRAAQRFGSKTALIAGGRPFTYRELHDMCDRVARGLHELGVRPGDRVNDCGAAAIFTAGDKAEVILRLTRALPALRQVVSFDPTGGGATSFADLLSCPAAAPEVARPAPSDLSTIGYTSGTTGHPKGAMQSHRAVFLNTAAVFAVQTRTERDVMLNALPLPHVYGNVVMNGTFMAGATLVMMERFDAALALAEIQRQHATVFDGVPTMYAMMLARPGPSRHRPVRTADVRGGWPDHAGREDAGMGTSRRGAPAGAVGDDRAVVPDV